MLCIFQYFQTDPLTLMSTTYEKSKKSNCKFMSFLQSGIVIVFAKGLGEHHSDSNLMRFKCISNLCSKIA